MLSQGSTGTGLLQRFQSIKVLIHLVCLKYFVMDLFSISNKFSSICCCDLFFIGVFFHIATLTLHSQVVLGNITCYIIPLKIISYGRVTC